MGKGVLFPSVKRSHIQYYFSTSHFIPLAIKQYSPLHSNPFQRRLNTRALTWVPTTKLTKFLTCLKYQTALESKWKSSKKSYPLQLASHVCWLILLLIFLTNSINNMYFRKKLMFLFTLGGSIKVQCILLINTLWQLHFASFGQM